MLKYTRVVKVTITSYTGFAAAPTVAVAQPKQTEPEGEKRPALRLVKSG